MTPREIENALGGMVVLVDTREQDTPRLRARLKQIGKYEREMLDHGDYSAKFPVCDGYDVWYRLNVCIERKADFNELTQCYCSGRERFEREFERAKRAKTKMYLLVENADWESAYRGNYISLMKPKSFIASMLAWTARYNCPIMFCSERTGGKLIRDILRYEGREMLERMMLNA